MTSRWESDLQEIVRGAEQDLRSLDGAHILLTGATGFFGVWLLHSFRLAKAELNLDLKLSCVSRNPQRFLLEHPVLSEFHWIESDITEIRDLPSGITHVMHGAATSARETFEGEAAASKYATIADGTRLLLSQLRKQQRPRFLYMSSGAVYAAPQNGEGISEDHLPAPLTHELGAGLAHAKRSAEFHCFCEHDRKTIDATVARCFSFLGPHLPLDLHYAAGNFIADALAGRSITLKGDGSPIRSYLYPTDLVVWLLATLTRGSSGATYNIGSPEPISIYDLAARVAKIAGTDVKRPDQAANAPTTSATNSYFPQTRKIENALMLKQSVSIDEAIQRTLAFYRG